VTVSTRRDTPDSASVLVVHADTASGEFTVTNRAGIPGAEDVTAPETVALDREGYLSNLEAQLADGAGA
jgi:hypothetical protein